MDDFYLDERGLASYFEVQWLESPSAVVKGLMERTRPGGIAVVSCSYQWSDKHLGDFDERVDDINHYFLSDWLKIGEAETDCKFRFNERFSRLFLSHVVAYKRL